MKSRAALTAIGVASIVVCVAQTALADQNGKTGYSGKSGVICDDCHYGGDTPTVTLTGPSTLMAGQKEIYTLLISGGAAVVGGLDVAVDNTDAKLGVVSANTKLLRSEITHTKPIAFANGSLSLQFSLTAPMTPGMTTIFAAGNSCDHSGDENGDAPAAATLVVTVAGVDDMTVEPDDMAQPSVDFATVTMPPQDGCNAGSHDLDGAAILALLIYFCARVARKRASAAALSVSESRSICSSSV